MKRRFHLLEDFFLNSAILELQAQPVPTSTTEEEIHQRKRELQFRLDLLRAVLQLTRIELASLTGARKAKR